MNWLQERWLRYWFAPAPPEPLALARVLFYALLLIDSLRRDITLTSGLSAELWSPLPLFALPPITPAVSAETLATLQWAFRGALLLACLGLWTRASTLAAAALGLFVLGWTNNFGQPWHNLAVPALLCCILAGSRCGDAFAVDALRRKETHPPSGDYRWPVRWIRLVAVLVFFCAGISKLAQAGWSWVSDTNLQRVLIARLYMDPAMPLRSLSEAISAHRGAAISLAAVTLTLELTTPCMLLWRKAALVYCVLLTLFVVGVRMTMGPDFIPLLFAFVFWLVPLPSGEIREWSQSWRWWRSWPKSKWSR